MHNRILCLVCAAALMMLPACNASMQPDDDPVSASPATISVIDAETSSEGVLEEGDSGDSSKAKEESGPLSVSVSEGVIGYASSEPEQVEQDDTTVQSTASAIGYYPYEIQYQNHNGSPVIIKSFKVPADVNPELLIEDDFTEDNYIYARRDILKKESEAKAETKTVAEVISFATADNEQATLRSALTPVIEYNEGGYVGQLTLDYSSIVSAASGEKSYTYPIRRVVEVDRLANNDYAYLDKEMNGLTLQGAEWSLRGGEQRAGSMVPGEYTAQAVYTGVGYGKEVTGYNNTAYYTGTVTRTVDGDNIYSIVYKGTKDPSVVEVVNDFPWEGMLIVLASIVLICGAAAFVYYRLFPWFKNRNNRRGPPPVAVPD